MIRAGVRRWFHLALRRADHWERDVEDEIKLHLTLRAEQLMAEGATPTEAYAEAVRRFGPLTQSRARLVDAARRREQRMQRTEYLAELRQDLRFAFRMLGRQKAWTAVAVLTLALGVGATTAVFSVVSRLMLHMLPYPGGDRLAFVHQQPSTGNNTGIAVTIVPQAQLLRAWKRDARSFEALEGFNAAEMQLRTSGTPATVNVGRVEPTFTTFAAQRPIAGRMFTADDIAAGGRVAVLGEGFWRSRFGGDQGVLGRTITLDDSLYTVIGVLPASLQWPLIGEPPRDVWLPLDLRDNNAGAKGIGRLRRGFSPEVATRELDSIYARASGFVGEKLPLASAVMPPSKELPYRDSLLMLTVAVALVLLIASANVAHLLMARAASRHRELAIRTALGAGRGRVFRQLLTESLVLALGGTALGVVFGWLGLKALIALRPPSLETLSRAHLDGTTLTVAALVAVLTGVVFGILGAVQSRKHSTHEALKAGVVRLGSGRGRWRTVLVMSEMALSAALVVGASMLVRSVIKLQNAPLGFEPNGLYAITFSGTKQRYATPEALGRLVTDIGARLRSIPGIQSVAITSTPPGWRSMSIGRLEIEGEPPPPETVTSFIDVNQVDNAFFPAMRLRVTQGTPFTDTTASANQVIVNAGFARRTWGEQSALGKRLRIVYKSAPAWLTVIGVAADAATSGPMSESTAPLLYTPVTLKEARAILVRTDGSSNPLPHVQSVVRSIDPLVAPTVTSVEERMAQTIAAPRFVMVLLTVFTILALSLAAIGLYGVMSYTVAEQTRDIGIRVALGASRSRIARAVIARGMAVAAVGSVAGIIAATWGTKLIEHQLYRVPRTDVVSFAAAVVVLLGAALVACIVPTRRALSVDPMTAIRSE